MPAQSFNNTSCVGHRVHRLHVCSCREINDQLIILSTCFLADVLMQEIM